MGAIKLQPHEHVVVRAEITNPPTCEQDMSEWVAGVIESIGMRLARGPISWYCEDRGNRGMTSVAVLTTSHIAVHIWDEVVPPIAQVDIYSCSNLDQNQVLQILHDKFGLHNTQWLTLDRSDGLTLKQSFGVKGID